MKKLIVLLFLNSFLVAAAPAIADTATPVQTLFEEKLPAAQISFGMIKLDNGFIYPISVEENHPLYNELSELDSAELEKFKKRRREILLKLSKVLSFNKVSNGLGYVENDKLSMVKDGSLPINPLDALAAAESDQPEMKLTENQKKNKRHALLAKILNGTDKFLFQNSKTAISSNEFGLDLALSLGSVIGGRGKYILGGAVGIQLIFGFDMVSKKTNFQLKLFVERATRGITGVFMPVGITPRIGGYMRASNSIARSYDITYAPVVPVYIARSNGMATVGATAPITPLSVLSGGLLAFLESAMSYEGKTKSITIMDSNTIRIHFSKLNDFINTFKKSIRPQSAPSCSSIFA